MAQRRMIARSLGSSQKYDAIQISENGLADFCHALFPLLVVNADDFGRLQGDAFTVKHSVFPISMHSLEDFETALNAMHSVGLIARWMDGLRWYVQIVNFQREQPGLLRAAKSKYPEPNAFALKHIQTFGICNQMSPTANISQQPLTDVNKRDHLPLKDQKDQKEGRNKNPLPPKGGRSKRPTRLELQQAERIRKNRHGCTHLPRCQNADDCLRVVVQEMRAKA